MKKLFLFKLSYTCVYSIYNPNSRPRSSPHPVRVESTFTRCGPDVGRHWCYLGNH